MDILGLLISVSKTKCKISPELMEFLSIDDQGIDGIEFMLKNENLTKRIPENIRQEYELFRVAIAQDLIKNISSYKKMLAELEKNLEPTINHVAEEIYELSKEEKLK